MRKLILASKNQHKILEFQNLLGSKWNIISCDQLDGKIEWEETGSSFRANALIKARAIRDHTADAVLADDSGLAVDILNGAPGVYSARYAGVDASDTNNWRKLLQVLRGIPLAERTARFVCVLCYIDTQGNVFYFEGECRGHILDDARGEQGFGYDPVFMPEGFDRSFAELSAQDKNRISHRSRALDAFQKHLLY